MLIGISSILSNSSKICFNFCFSLSSFSCKILYNSFPRFTVEESYFLFAFFEVSGITFSVPFLVLSYLLNTTQ